MWELPLEPPEGMKPDRVCPECGAYLYEADGDALYVVYINGYRREIGCNHCIDDLKEYV